MIQLSDEYFMREALKEAEKAYEAREVPVGAVVVSNNQIIARAYNQVERLQDATAHAEMLALTAAFSDVGGKYLPSCTLYVTLEPCCMCGGATYWAQLGRLVFGAHDPRRGYSTVGRQLLHPRTEVTEDVHSEEASQLLTRFFKRLRS
ncbi:MAG TPA: tRNA-specific adenosine deaminase [Amoebophilaceae bacterium]|nr:tRNA-specific adenosine deaminase [Amoebophilaceae bacterium]